MTATMAVSN